MLTILVTLAVLTLVGIGCHMLTMRLLAWRGVTVEHTQFGLGFLFDTTDEDGTSVRMLNVNGTFQSACYLDDALWCELVCLYHRTIAEIASELPRLRTVAVIGGGGFSLPKWFAYHLAPVRVVAVEVDPKIIEIARRSFYLDRAERELAGTGRLEVVCADGWTWLSSRDEPLDLVVNDAFSGRQPLAALAAGSGARTIHEHLSEGGVYLANVRAPLTGRGARALHETLSNFATEFAHVWFMPECPEEPRRLGNNVLVASDTDLVASGCHLLMGHVWCKDALPSA